MLAIATVFALTACGSPSTTSSTSTGTPTGKGSGVVKSIDVCAVLPAAQAAKLSGQPYTAAVPVEASVSGWTSGCAYNNDDSTAQGVNVSVDTSDRVTSTWDAVHTGSVSDISGVGDKAFWDNDNTLYARFGSALIQVNGLDSQDASEALAKVIVDALR